MRRTEVLPISRRREISDLLIPWRNSFRTPAALIAAVAGRPRRVPLCQAWSGSARTRSRRMSCSKATNTESMPAIARPVDVVRSSASLSETKPMLRSMSSWSVLTRSSRERPLDPAARPAQHRSRAAARHRSVVAGVLSARRPSRLPSLAWRRSIRGSQHNRAVRASAWVASADRAWRRAHTVPPATFSLVCVGG